MPAIGKTSFDSDQPLVAGQLLSSLSHVSLLDHQEQIIATLLHTVHLSDIALLALLGWCSLPVARLVYELYFKKEKKDRSVQSRRRFSFLLEDVDPDEDPFFSSAAFFVGNLMSQVAKLACLVYLFDCLVIIFDIATPELVLEEYEVSVKFAKLVYLIWAAVRLMSFKRYLLCVAVHRPIKKLGRVGVYDRILDLFILFSLAVALLDIFGVDIGPGLASLFAFGGVGTLVVSLACKDLAAQLVSGVVVSTQENFYVGDNIKLGGDTCGIIDSIGWFYTGVRGKAYAPSTCLQA